MGDWLRRNPMLAVLAFVAAILAAVLAIELTTGGPSIPATASRKAVPAEPKLLPPMVAVAPEQAYPETAARPLFAPTRRPAPAVVATAQPAIQRNQFQLLGVTIAGNTRIAMLRERSSGRLHRVETGRDLNGMRVAEIQPEAVTLAVGAEQVVVTLTVQKAGATPGAPATVAAVPPQGPFLPPSAPAAPPQAQAPGPGGAVPQRSAPTAGNVPAPGMPPSMIPTPAGAPGMPGGMPAPPNPPTQAAPMTPQELLERRRARRAQQTQ